MTLTAVALVKRLVALVPPRGLHLTCFHGVFGPNGSPSLATAAPRQLSFARVVLPSLSRSPFRVRRKAQAWSTAKSVMKVGYVVLYVNDGERCRRFWVEQVGMVEGRRTEGAGFTVAQVGFADQAFSRELVPREMMKNNPDGLDLAMPSICFHVDDLEATRAALVARGVSATEVGDHRGMRNFAFSDPEGRWFAVTR